MEFNNWYAWINRMPPKPDDFHVIGNVLVSNPGITAQLTAKVPQGFNPAVLLLELHLVQRPGMWPQVETYVQVGYDIILKPDSQVYEQVDIFYENESIALIPVNEVR